MPTNLIGAAGHALHREGGTAAGVRVELGEDDAVDRQSFIEDPRRVDGVLPRHRVDYEVGLVGTNGVADAVQFLHEVVVDVQSTRGVEQQHVVFVLLRLAVGSLADTDRHARRRAVLGAFVRLGVEPDLRLSLAVLGDAFDHQPQLLDRGGTLQVGGGHQHAATALFEPGGELPARRRLPRTLQAADHEHRRARVDEHHLALHRSHQLDQVLVDDADHLFAGTQTLRHVGAQRGLDHLLAERIDHTEVDVGFEQCGAHLLHRLAHVRFGDAAAARELAEGAGESICERVEHGGWQLVRGRRSEYSPQWAGNQGSLAVREAMVAGRGRPRSRHGARVASDARCPLLGLDPWLDSLARL